MNKMALLIFFFTTLFTSEITYYWNLGIAIKKDKPTKRIVQKEVNLSNSTFYAQAAKAPQGVYTLQTNYLIAPEKQNRALLKSNSFISNSSKTIKELIVGEEYFEAAKQIITLKESEIDTEFESADDFHYWSSFIYFNLGNQDAAMKNIDQVSNKENDVRSLFLESLIMRKTQSQESDNLLKQIIKNFPNNEYSKYARSLLIDGK
mgnify:CR=1 FL=1